jgi:hypothetical protein
MPRNSKNPPPMTKAEIEAEKKAADWYASPAGRKHIERVMDEGMRKGTAVVVKNGKVKFTDPAILEALMQKARDKMTQAVSLRIPQSDLDAAKRIAVERGIGYQTVLKELIHQGVQLTASPKRC